jgi:uncharacterized protein
VSVAREAPARITSFLVKVASRCNLDCDYCYVYHHADQTWRSMPRLLSSEDRAAFACQLGTYVREAGINRCAVIFHGGEPLLAGVDTLVAFAAQLRESSGALIEFGLQTNGLLLTEAALQALEVAEISVSLSLDGPREANDKHRTTKKRRSSFDKVLEALERLKGHPKIFAGIIAVIDPTTSPEDLFAFFDPHRPPKLDFLLPDAHHLRPPPGRGARRDLYESWQIRAFDLWLDRYPHLPVRTFEALLDSVSGMNSGTDAFGLGDVSLISIESDGSYHDLDVLKVTRDGATKIGGTVHDTSIAQIAASEHLAAHRRLLSKEGLCEMCRSCEIVSVCGGGSLPHRYGSNGFDNPTVYCGEMLSIVAHVRKRLADLMENDARTRAELAPSVDLEQFEKAELSETVMGRLLSHHRTDSTRGLLEAAAHLETAEEPPAPLQSALMSLHHEHLADLSVQPGIVAWQRAVSAHAAGRSIHAIDGRPLEADAAYLRQMLARERLSLVELDVGRCDLWLRAPFGGAIVFEDEAIATGARPLVESALQIIAGWRPALAEEIRRACRSVQFVRDPLADPEKIVSFSDNTVPGALYVSVVRGDGLISPYDLADSLVHEHRHQKLYLLERLAPMAEPTNRLVVSPWREDPRPPSGLLHAVFVFVELRRFWTYVRDNGPVRLRKRATNQIQETDENLRAAFRTLESCPLTSAGQALTQVLMMAAQDEFGAP